VASVKKLVKNGILLPGTVAAGAVGSASYGPIAGVRNMACTGSEAGFHKCQRVRLTI